MKKITLRPYQQRLLDYVRTHKQQMTYHFVAPPGSGKTILGLAILEELHAKTLILVPSLLLKEQWIKNAQKFLDVSISNTLLQPETITITTYQAAYQYLQDQPDYFNQNNIDFLILDEAHHLKKNWGELLFTVKRKYKKLRSLSLTATPPLDSPQIEWQMYLALNGPIDEEISASELVKRNILNPYQDFIHFIQADATEEEDYHFFLEQQNDIIDRLLTDNEVINYLLSQSFITDPLIQTDAIYKHFDLYISMLLFLTNNGFKLNSAHWKVLGFKKKSSFPMISKAQIRLLYDWLWSSNPELSIFTYLQKVHWLKEEQLCLYPSFPVTQLIGSHQSRLAAIEEIIIKEEANLGAKLCSVVLFDRIAEAAFDFPDNPTYYGVVPQFLRLQSLLQKETELALLCGRFAFLSEKIATTFFSNETFQKQVGVLGYIRLNLTDSNRRTIVEQVTSLLNEGILHVLVGTIALLGEGWDCPNVNTLILGNRSSSFVQTQQLRGRVLRSKPEKPLSSIWHLSVFIDRVPWQEQPELAPVIRRLSFIEGISNEQLPKTITSGQERYNFPAEVSEQALRQYNQKNFYFIQQRERLAKIWAQALTNGSQLSMPLFIRPTRQNNEVVTKEIAWQHKRLTFWQSFFHGDLTLYFQQQKMQKKWQQTCHLRSILADSLLQVYQEQHHLSKKVNLNISIDEQQFSVRLDGATYQEEHFFNDALIELLQPIQDTRYLIQLRKRYFAVPKNLAKNKETATKLIQKIRQKQKHCELIYTRNLLGRQKLLQARIEALLQQTIQITQKHLWH